jgi:predicted NBD/HSP70 family sugar kinase
MRKRSARAATASTSFAEGLTSSERRLITLLALHGALTKRALSRRAGLAWSTVVKIIGRFEKSGLVRRKGTAPREPNGGGKNAYLYSLDDGFGHVIGVDVEYRRMRLIAKTLSGTVLRTVERESPKEPALERFLGVVSDAIDATEAGLSGRLLGIGVGMPLWMVRGGAAIRRDVFRRVEEALGDRHGVPARVHNNIRAYATYLAHGRRGTGDFLLVTIRTGLGFGIHVGGSVMRGGDGLAGEVAHLQVDPGGPICRCGKRGCVETFVNGDAIVRDYSSSSGRGEASLSEIAALADYGDHAAVSTLDRAAAALSKAVAAVILVLDVPEIIVAAAFGRKGRVFAAMLEKHLKGEIFPHPGLRIRYDSLDSDGFLHGAALLALRDCYEQG